MQAQGIRQNPVFNYGEGQTTGSPEELSSSIAGRFSELLGQLVGGGSGWTPDLAGLMATAAVQAPPPRVEVPIEPEQPVVQDAAEEEEELTLKEDGEEHATQSEAAAAPVAKKPEARSEETFEAAAEEQVATEQDDSLPSALKQSVVALQSEHANPEAAVAADAQLAAALPQQAAAPAAAAQRPTMAEGAPAAAVPTQPEPQTTELQQVTAGAKPGDQARGREHAAAKAPGAVDNISIADTVSDSEVSLLETAESPTPSFAAKVQAAVAEGAQQLGRTTADRKLSFGEYDAKFGGARGSAPVQGTDAHGAPQANAAGAEKLAGPKIKGGAPALTPEDRVKMLQEMKEMLKKAALSRDGNTISVRVEPQELGKMSVRIQHRDGEIHARIIPESAEVEQLLRDNAQEMTQALASAGVRADQVQLSIGRERIHSESFRFAQNQGGLENQRSNEQGGSHSDRGERAHNGTQGFGADTPSPAAQSTLLTAESGWIA